MRRVVLIRLFVAALVGLAADTRLVGDDGRGGPPVVSTVESRSWAFSDSDLRSLPEMLEVLTLRGQRAYGPDGVTDEGIRRLTRYKKLRKLHADGLGLTDGALETIAKIATLEELSLDSNAFTTAGLRRLARLKNLRRLSLNFNPAVPDFAVLGELSELTELSVLGAYVVDDGILKECGRLRKLETLRLPDNTEGVTDEGLTHLTALARLKILQLHNANDVTDAGLATLAQLESLEYLTLAGLRSTTPTGLRFLKKLAKLRRLEIISVPITDPILRIIGRLSKLESLTLWNAGSDPVDLEELAGLHRLREIRTNQKLTSTAIRTLCGLRELESIKEALTEISDDDLTHLARLPKLRILILDSDKVTAASLPTLARMRSLKELYVTEAVKITPAQWSSLGEASLPHCRIMLWFSPYTVYHEPRD